ncbi:MAG: YgiT-type zinc finger protein [Planctomycetota bacterium]
MTCEVCGNTSFHRATVSHVFHVDGRLVCVEDIPAEVCDRCGEENFTAEVAERLRVLVREPTRAERTVPAEIVRYHAA